MRINRNPAFDSLPTIKPVRREPERGKQVFFFGYQVDQEGGRRYPNQAQARADTHSKRSYGYPAQFAAVVLGRKNGVLEVATGFQGYGPARGRQKNINYGDSGGPVVTGLGKLVGITARMNSGSVSVETIERRYDLDLPVPNDTKLKTAYVEPITRKVLAEDRRALGRQGKC